MEIASNHTVLLPAPRAAVWEALGGVSHYRTWWPWLRRFDATCLDEGDVWRCTIRPPLPYVLRCTVELTSVRAPELVVARLAGDIAGDARLELNEQPAGPATEARITSGAAAVASGPTGRSLGPRLGVHDRGAPVRRRARHGLGQPLIRATASSALAVADDGQVTSRTRPVATS
jgi:uncharacterized protein YndB with AHSA1/START domain